MNPASDTGSPPAAAFSRQTPNPTPPTHWRAALMALVTARLALVEFEGQRAARLGIRRVVCGVALGVCLVFMWALLLAGGIAWIAASLDQPWWQIALAASGVHLLAAMVLARALQAAVPPLFPVTRAEFHRDREWIENLHKSPKSDA